LAVDFLTLYAHLADSPERALQVGRNIDAQSIADDDHFLHPCCGLPFLEPVPIQWVAPSVRQRVELRGIVLKISQVERACDRFVVVLYWVKLDDADRCRCRQGSVQVWMSRQWRVHGAHVGLRTSSSFAGAQSARQHYIASVVTLAQNSSRIP